MVLHTVYGVQRDIDVPAHAFPTNEELQAMDSIPPSYNSSSDNDKRITCERGWFDSCRGSAKLFYRKWSLTTTGGAAGSTSTKRPTTPKAIIIHTHGIQTHSGNGGCRPDGRLLEAALRVDALVGRGQCVLYAHDMYGHGLSEGTRFFIPDGFETNLTDFATFVKLVVKEQAAEGNQDVPLILMGESYGACLTLHLARYYQDHPDMAPRNVDSLILTASAIDADLPPYPVQYLLKHWVAPLFPHWVPFFMPNPVNPDRIWRNADDRRQHTHPRIAAMRFEGCGRPFCLQTASALLDALVFVKSKVIPGLRVPYCLIHGTEDGACPLSGAEYLWNTTTFTVPPPDREYHALPGFCHALFSDPESEQAVQPVVQWIEKRVKHFPHDSLSYGQ